MVATAELARPTAPEPCAPGRLGWPGNPERWLLLACACQQAGLPAQQVRHARRVLDLVPAAPPQPPRTGSAEHLELRLRASALAIGGLAAGGKRDAAAAALKDRLAELRAAGQGERAEVEAFAGLALYGAGGGDTAHRLRAALAWAAEHPDLGELEAEAALALAAFLQDRLGSPARRAQVGDLIALAKAKAPKGSPAQARAWMWVARWLEQPARTGRG